MVVERVTDEVIYGAYSNLFVVVEFSVELIKGLGVNSIGELRDLWPRGKL